MTMVMHPEPRFSHFPTVLPGSAPSFCRHSSYKLVRGFCQIRFCFNKLFLTEMPRTEKLKGKTRYLLCEFFPGPNTTQQKSSVHLSRQAKQNISFTLGRDYLLRTKPKCPHSRRALGVEMARQSR
jgi:hypothetical protein